MFQSQAYLLNLLKFCKYTNLKKKTFLLAFVRLYHKKKYYFFRFKISF